MPQSAWALNRPKTGNRERLKENASELEHPLSAAHLHELDSLFPPPKGSSLLAMIRANNTGYNRCRPRQPTSAVVAA